MNIEKSVKDTKFWIAVLSITLFAAGLRLYQLGNSALGIDELHTIRHSLHLWEGQVLRQLCYAPFAWWMELSGIPLAELGGADTWRAAGVTEGLIRFPSALFGILAIPLLILAVRPVLGMPTALVTGLFLAVAPWHMSTSQYARFYTLAFLLYSIGLVLYLHSTLDGKFCRFVLAMALLVGAVFVQPITGLGFALIALDALVFRRDQFRDWRRAIAYLLAGGICAGALLVDMMSREVYADQLVVSPRSPVYVAQRLFWAMTPVLCIWSVLAVPLMWKENRRVTGFLAITGWLMVVLGILASFKAFIFERYVITLCLAPIIILAAWGTVRAVEALRQRQGWAFALAPFLAVLAVWGATIFTRFATDDDQRWSQAVKYVEDRREPGDTVFVVQATRDLAVAYYLGEPVEYLPMGEGAMEVVSARGPAWFVVNGGESDFELKRRFTGSRDPFFSESQMHELGMEFRAIWYNRDVVSHDWVRVYYASE